MEGGLDGASRSFPTAVFERGDGQTELEFEGVLGVKVAATVATHDLELAVNSLDDVCGGEGFPHVFGVFQKRQEVRSLLVELADPGGIGVGESVTEFFELAVSDLDVPGGFDGAPALLKSIG